MTCPVSNAALVMTGTVLPALLTVMVNAAVPEPAEFDAVRVTVETPAVVGVPEISPKLGSTLRPEGSPVAPKLVGTLLAVI